MAIDRQNIKDKFRKEGDMPESFSWDNMHQGIVEKMNLRSTKKKNPLFLILGIGIVFLLCFGIINTILHQSVEKAKVLSITKTNTEKEKAIEPIKSTFPTQYNKENLFVIDQQQANINESTEILNVEVSKDKDISLQTDSYLEKKSLQIERQNLNKQTEVKTSTSNFNSNSATYNDNNLSQDNIAIINKLSKDSAKDVSVINDVFNLTKENSKAEISSIDNEGQLKNKSDDFIQANDDIKNESIKEIESNFTVHKLSLLKISELKSLNQKQQTHLYKVDNNVNNKKAESDLNHIIYLSGGSVLGKATYGNDALGKVKSIYEKDLLGQQFGFGLEYKITNRLSLDASLNFNQVKSILDYKEITKYSEKRDNVLLAIEVNTVTKDTIKNFGSANVTGIQTRTVKHYNTERMISMPIVMKYNWDIGKLRIGAGLGAGLLYSLSNQGRTIVAIDSFNTIGNDYTTKIGVSGLGQINVTYSLSDRINIGLKTNYMMPLLDQNKNVGTAFRRNLLSGQLLIGYRF
jgi:hypothetical protein